MSKLTKIKNFLKRIQSLPLKQRKIILWIIVTISALLFIFLYIQIMSKRWGSIKTTPSSLLEETSEATTTPLDFWSEILPESDGATSTLDFDFSPETKEKAVEFLESLLKELKEPEDLKKEE